MSHALAGEMVAARWALERIDYAGLREERARALEEVRDWVARSNLPAPTPAPRTKSRIDPMERFLADGFRCRYAHCRKRLIYSPVLAVLSRPFSDLLGNDPQYPPAWPPLG